MSKNTFDRLKPHLTGPIKPPPPPPPPDGLTISTTAGVVTQAKIDFPDEDAAGYYLIIEATNGMSPGVTQAKRSAFKLLQSTEIVGLLGTLDFTASYVARFGAASVGAKVFCRVSVIDSVSGFRWTQGIFSAITT